MSSKADQLVAEVLALPSQLRAYIAEKLLESLDVEKTEELSSEWRQEVSRRCSEIDSQAISLQAAADVMSKAFRSVE